MPTAAQKTFTDHAAYQPAGFPRLTPYITVRNGEKSLEFYGKAFGFTVDNEVMRDDKGVVLHAGMRLGECAIMFAPEGSWGGTAKSPASMGGAQQGISLYVYVPDVDGHCQTAKSAGATILMEPKDEFWGDRVYACSDIDGYHWMFGTFLSEQKKS